MPRTISRTVVRLFKRSTHTVAAGIGRSLEHLTIHLVNDLPRIRRAWLLGRRERRDNDQRADEYSYTPHGNLLSSAPNCVCEQRCTSIEDGARAMPSAVAPNVLLGAALTRLRLAAALRSCYSHVTPRPKP